LEDYAVAGKTGTAQQMGFVNGIATMDAGKYAALFIGFFPADDPEVCISVVINNPDSSKGYYGGSTAAPHWQKIASRTAQFLNIPPDKISTTQSLQMAENRNH
jgi:cell division protein FtsI/penicillin-binding protein 2